ncbi:MAG: hypothetical protein IJ881_05710 [Neisseriaceae bacterium]|nr:hypothetical protein [Neisseriaceae bacterium]MBR3424965.1 hypothetical protein [Neisseriaceae bacterium]
MCNLLHTRFNHIFNLPELLSSVTVGKNAHPTAFLLLFRLPERLNAMPLQRLQRCILLTAKLDCHALNFVQVSQ